MTDIKISCIIPYHNEEEELLRECINSILQQDLAEYEILLINDGSDTTHTACLDAVCHLDGRIRMLPGPGRGVSAARNAGVREARGEYVAFVDTDDTVVPYFFSEAYRVVTEQNAVYVVGKNITTYDRKLWPSRIPSPKIVECDAAKYRIDFLVDMEKTQDGGYFGRGPVARLISRDVALRIPFPENVTMGEDSIWNMDVIAACNTICKVYQIWYIYWQHPDSACHRYDADMIDVVEEHLREMSRRMDFSRENEAEAYFIRMYELLRQQAFGCYLGRKECPLPLRQRARMFRELLRREPWNCYEGHMDPQHCDRRTRGKYRLAHSGLLFWFWYFRQLVRGRGKG